MSKVKILIQNTALDLFSDETIQVNQSIQNVKDIGSVFSNFSQSFSVPASPTNNQIFEYYYNYSLQNGFDARYKVSGSIYVNDLPFDTGYYKLNEVKLKNNKPYSYNITFFGALVNLKDLFGQDKLSDLDLSAYDISYTQANVKTLLNEGNDINGITDALITPLISAKDTISVSNTTTTDNVIWKNLKYAIKLRALLKAIEDDYGITFSGDFITDNVPFNSLYMWLHRDKGYTKLPSGTYTSYWSGLETKTLWGGGGSTNNQGWGFFSYGNSHNVTLTLDVGSTDEFEIQLYVNNSLFWTKTYSGATAYNVNFNDGSSMSTIGIYDVKIKYTNPISVTASSVWQFTLNATTPATTNAAQSAYTFGSTFLFNASGQIPDMSVIDFLTALFKMFNLTAYKDTDGSIVLKTLSDYYSTGTIRDWTNYLDTSNMSVSPLTLYKEMRFEYEGLGTILADQHTKQFNVGWGTEKYSTGNKFEGETYSIVLPFEHMKFERLYTSGGSASVIQYGLSLDSNLNEYIGKPLVFMATKETGVVNVADDSGANPQATTYYYRPTNVLGIGGSIHFSTEFDEYSGTAVSNSLFSVYYSDYISSVFNIQSRLVRLTGRLPLYELLEYNLNDKIQVLGNYYNINTSSINLSTGFIDLELKNIV